jgi:hypothetical protein
MTSEKHKITAVELRNINRTAFIFLLITCIGVCFLVIVLGLSVWSLISRMSPQIVAQVSPSTNTPPPATPTMTPRPVYTLTLMEESCPTYPVGTNFEGWISKSNDPLTLWSKTSVHFKGTDQCGKPEIFGGASLIYRYRFEFTETTQLTSISVSGAAFNGPNSLLRVLDEDMNIVGSVNTFGGNSFNMFRIDLDDVKGRIFYIDEFDTSPQWRFRDGIVVK